MISLNAFLDELVEIIKMAIPTTFAPTQARLRGAAPLPAPAPLPNINAATGSGNYKMHMPTVLANMKQQAATSTVRPGTPKTIPAVAGSLPGAGGLLGAAERATMHAPSSFPASVAKTIAAPAARIARAL